MQAANVDSFVKASVNDAGQCLWDHVQTRIGHPPTASISRPGNRARCIGKRPGRLPKTERRCPSAEQDRDRGFGQSERSPKLTNNKRTQPLRITVAWRIDRLAFSSTDQAPIFFHYFNVRDSQPGRDVNLAVRYALVDLQFGN